MATLTPLTLTRPTEATPWGFRLVGGADYKSCLRIQRVTPGSIAAQHLGEGDTLVTLEGEDAKALCHFDACDLVKHSGTRLSLTVRKAASIQYLHEENKVNQEKLEQIIVEEQKQQELERKYRRAMSTPPRDANPSNRSTPQRMVSSPSNAISSPRPVQSLPSRVASPSCSVAEPSGIRTSQGVFSPCRLIMSPSAKSQSTGNASARNIQMDEKFQESGSPLSWVGANPTSPAMRNVISPTQRSTPPNLVNSGHFSPGICSPPYIMSPPITSPRTNVTSPPSFTSPPPRYPNASTSSRQAQPVAVGDLGASSYSTPTLVLSPNQFHAPNNPVDASSVTFFPFPPREEQAFETESAAQEQQFSYHEEQNVTADAQRRQLQLMIQEKLRLEEKMMIAKRREGSRAEKMNKTKSVSTPKHEAKSVSSSSPRPPVSEPSVNLQLKTVPFESKSEVSRTLVTNAVRTVQQEVLKATTSAQDRFAMYRDEIKPDMNITTETTDANQKIQVTPKVMNPQEEANRMLDKLKKTARDKIAEFQKSFSLSRCVDETEQLREANRIRDEEIRKMQEHNLNQKQNKHAPKGAYSAQVEDGPKGTDLRKVKTESNPGESDSISAVFPLQSPQPVTDSLDGNVSTVMSSVLKIEKKEAKSAKKDISEVEKAKIKDFKKKEDLKKIQEQFKKDQLLIQAEMQKKEAKAFREKRKLDEIEAKERAELQRLKDLEEKQLLAKIIYEEEQKLLAQKKQVEEKIANEQRLREEEARQVEVRDKIAREKEKFAKTIQVKEKKAVDNEQRRLSDDREPNHTNRTEKSAKKSIKESYESLKMKTYEQKRIEMQKAVQVQHVKSALQLSEALKRQSYTNLDDPHIYEDVNPVRPSEKKFDTLKQEEERQMLEEAKQYEDYRRHLESKHKTQVEDSDDYASEWDESSEASVKNYNNLQHEEAHDPEEPFDELKATSEEELLEAQEKSIRNLERQIRKQKEKDRRRNSLDSDTAIDRSRTRRRNQTSSQVPLRSQSERRPYSSTGDLRKSSSRTLPITKFSPDPMEFGFKPIESPTFSKSMSNLDKGGSAESGAAVAGAQAGAMATGLLVCPAPGLTNADLLSKTHTLSASLGDLQQVASKPPLPAGAGKLRLRHATSDELLCRAPETGAHDKARRFSYAPGEDVDSWNLAPLQEGSWGAAPGEEEGLEDTVDLQTMEYYNRLLSEYYSAYYEAYYLSYYRKQQEELKSGKVSTMNGPAGPPPPPPPPPFVVPGATPPPAVQPPLAMARPGARPGPQVPLVAPPAALAGAMMKDKKPFTYTPGGLDLSEISPGPVPDSAPVQSRSFRVLQQVVDNETSEAQAVDQAFKGPQQQQARAFGNNSTAIPSRAFRALQQQTGGGDGAAGPGESDL